jgi:hypothetical protein
MNSDITRVRFGEDGYWGTNKKQKFKVAEEEKFEHYPNEVTSLNNIKALYRNLRENYEYRLVKV